MLMIVHHTFALLNDCIRDNKKNPSIEQKKFHIFQKRFWKNRYELQWDLNW